MHVKIMKATSEHSTISLVEMPKEQNDNAFLRNLKIRGVDNENKLSEPNVDR